MSNEYGPPVLVSFGITRECDLECPHCYSDSGERDAEELSTEEAKRVITEIADLGAKIVILDGGEPTLRVDLVDLVAHANDFGLKVVLGSNGMSLTEELVSRLLSAGCGGIAISLDGADSRTHDGFRGLDGGWERTIQGAKNCANLGMPFQIAPLMYRDNWKQLEDIVSKAMNLGANAVEVFDYVPAGRGRGRTEYELETDQRKKIIDQVIRWQSKGDIIFRVIALPQYWVQVEREVPEDEVLEKYTRSCCAAGTRYITILPNGDVIPCMVLQVKLGNVRENSLKEIWYGSPILETLRNRDLLKGKCGRCKYRISCAGARCKAYEKTGDMMAEDPTCWFPEDVISGDRELKTMEWDESVWAALKYAVTGMPVFVRKRALRKIIEASEENARKRSSDIVQAPDLVLAAKEKVPKSVRGVCFDALREYGIHVQ